MTNRMNKAWEIVLIAAGLLGATGSAWACGPFEFNGLVGSATGNQIPAIICDLNDGASTRHFSFPAIDLGDPIEIQVSQEQDGKVTEIKMLRGETTGFRCFSPDHSLAYMIRVSESDASETMFQMHVSADRSAVKGALQEGLRSTVLSCKVFTRGIVSGGN